MTSAIMNTYGRMDVAFVKGEGAWLIDDQGNRYLDALSGIGVVGLGHSHPAVSQTIADQASSLLHTSNLYQIPNQQQLADELTRISGMDNVFFANSGAEANECAIKISRLHASKREISHPNIIVTDDSFHGRTLATLTATGNRKVQAGFEPLVHGFVRAPFNDLAAIEQIAANTSDIVAVFVEPIQGEGGVKVPADSYLAGLRAICDREGWLLMVDEVQTGNGRTGRYFAYQHTDILPDVVTTAKGLGNGVPIGVCMARGEAAQTLQPGNHGSTFGGNPLSCAVGLKVIETIEEERIAERAGLLGQRMLDAFAERLEGANHVTEVRGKGLMIGIELDQPCGDLVQKAQDRGLLINVAAGSVVRLLPPLVISDEEADRIVDVVSELIREL